MVCRNPRQRLSRTVKITARLCLITSRLVPDPRPPLQFVIVQRESATTAGENQHPGADQLIPDVRSKRKPDRADDRHHRIPDTLDAGTRGWHALQLAGVRLLEGERQLGIRLNLRTMRSKIRTGTTRCSALMRAAVEPAGC